MWSLFYVCVIYGVINNVYWPTFLCLMKRGYPPWQVFFFGFFRSCYSCFHLYIRVINHKTSRTSSGKKTSQNGRMARKMEIKNKHSRHAKHDDQQTTTTKKAENVCNFNTVWPSNIRYLVVTLEKALKFGNHIKIITIMLSNFHHIVERKSKMSAFNKVSFIKEFTCLKLRRHVESGPRPPKMYRQDQTISK